MARFSVYLTREDRQLVLDCQSHYLSQLDTRLVVPLLPATTKGVRLGTLTPEFDVEGESVIMATQFASVIPKSELGRPVTNLADEDYHIIRALDVLIGTA